MLNKESTADFFKVLSTNKDSWIPRDLPADVKIADKPGSLEAVRNDSGVVFVEGHPYVICVMTAFLANERDGEQAISKISLAAWRMFDRLSRASEYGRVVSPGKWRSLIVRPPPNHHESDVQRGQRPLGPASGAAQQTDHLGIISNLGPRQRGIAGSAAQVHIRSRRQKSLDNVRVCFGVSAGENQSCLPALV